MVMTTTPIPIYEASTTAWFNNLMIFLLIISLLIIVFDNFPFDNFPLIIFLLIIYEASITAWLNFAFQKDNLQNMH